MTHRYLESIGSGCIVLGHAPVELVELMGFNPVVEVDWSAPADQALEILADSQKWQPHVDRALQRLSEVGDWGVRVGTIRATLEETGLLSSSLR
ncbi:hypothetical protein [Actinacidiphila soli]|uniref:hypothetical protein n=1 Tax=Actinacidiphila soli TaxID=2487275 RepID=UPI000FCAEAC8|nr:hypothetical protein [Actinacidiphila soli]